MAVCLYLEKDALLTDRPDPAVSRGRARGPHRKDLKAWVLHWFCRAGRSPSRSSITTVLPDTYAEFPIQLHEIHTDQTLIPILVSTRSTYLIPILN
ncbi:hypothetical protein MA16_Dca023766 [Dendrobium catenatum]|uniref:Uncharacterized protein n=1 Tax=Dendrobium catenatum TaxID=906689 RepID=A0A2I0X1A9_9ASPA|nr:hypothetical protein MA16_Dca023766 [Dendrobium catenatum]